MATYNRAHFIVETLRSIQNQIFESWQCLIIDDGGTDNTLEIITSILNKDSRFKFLKRPDNYKKGLPGCRNYGIDLVKFVSNNEDFFNLIKQIKIDIINDNSLENMLSKNSFYLKEYGNYQKPINQIM